MPVEGGTLRPVAHAKYIVRAGYSTMETTSRFVAGGGSFDTQGIQADRSSLDLGPGLTFASVHGVDLSLDYDADIRSSLIGHAARMLSIPGTMRRHRPDRQTLERSFSSERR